jgi:predicted transcriptional regulator
MERSYVGPAFADATVHDAMRVGVITCRPQTSLTDVARMMSGYEVHSVIVEDRQGGRGMVGIITSLDLARVADRLESLTAQDIAADELITVSSGEPLRRAAELLAEHKVSHLVATQPDTGEPAGVISARGIAAAIAYGTP